MAAVEAAPYSWNRSIPLWDIEPGQPLLGDREENEAYLAADPAVRPYALYFTNGGSVTLDLAGARLGVPLQLQWISVATGKPVGDPTPVASGKVVTIKAPDDVGSVAAITPRH